MIYFKNDDEMSISQADGLLLGDTSEIFTYILKNLEIWSSNVWLLNNHICVSNPDSRQLFSKCLKWER